MSRILFHIILIALFVIGAALIVVSHEGIKPGTVTGIDCNNVGVCRITISNNLGWFDIPWNTAKTLEFGHCYDTSSWNEVMCPG